MAYGLQPHYNAGYRNDDANDEDNEDYDNHDNNMIIMTGKMSSQFNLTYMDVQKLLIGNFSISSSGDKLLTDFGIYDPQNSKANYIKLGQPDFVFQISNLRPSSIQQSDNNVIISGTVDVIVKSLRPSASSNNINVKNAIMKTSKNVPATVSVIDQCNGGLFILDLDKSSSVRKVISDTPILGIITKSSLPQPSSSFSKEETLTGQDAFADQFHDQHIIQKSSGLHVNLNLNIQQNNLTGDNRLDPL